jgi:hypothetical protein
VGERFSVNGWQFTVHSKEGPRLERIRLLKLPRNKAGTDGDGRPTVKPPG